MVFHFILPKFCLNDSVTRTLFTKITYIFFRIIDVSSFSCVLCGIPENLTNKILLENSIFSKEIVCFIDKNLGWLYLSFSSESTQRSFHVISWGWIKVKLFLKYKFFNISRIDFIQFLVLLDRSIKETNISLLGDFYLL